MIKKDPGIKTEEPTTIEGDLVSEYFSIYKRVIAQLSQMSTVLD